MKRLSHFEVAACLLGMTMAFTVGLVALATGHNGVIVGAVCTAIGVLVGYVVRGGHTAAPHPPGPPFVPPLKPIPPEDRIQQRRRRYWHSGRRTWEKG